MTALLTNRAFQAFFTGLAAMVALIVLLVTNSIAQAVGVPLLTSVIGFTLGVPVTAPNVSAAPPPSVSAGNS